MKRPPTDRLAWTIPKICLLIAIIMAFSCNDVIAANSGQFRRLAILSTEEVQETGLSDLLMVQMQELAGIELVERDMMEKLLDEVALSMMLGAEQTENRRKAGVLLKADMLVLLSLEEGLEKPEDKKKVKVIMSDCTSGARLYIGWVLFDDYGLENTCRSLTKLVNDTLERFRTGVKQIIGVSHFLSRNLVHDYDHLQAAYAYLLENALTSLSGTAVIEIEEARSIRYENELTADTISDRVVPLFVEGEFTVQNAVSTKQAKVNMTIRISDSTADIKQIERDDLSADQVAVFIADDIAQDILKLSKNYTVEPFDKEKQFLALVNRALDFAEVGAWEHSTGLREAAILLKPDSAEQRIKLINEYYRIRRLLKRPGSSFGKFKCAQWKWQPALEHLEYLIFNKMIDINNATKLGKKCFDRIPVTGKSYKREFLRKVYPEILNLKPPLTSAGDKQKGYEQWYKLLVRQVGSARFHDPYIGSPDQNDLKLYLDLHNSVLPEEMGPSRWFILFLNDHTEPGWRKKTHVGPARWYFGQHPEYFSEQQFLDFITAMSRSKKPLSSFYGRYALLLHEYYKRRMQGKPVDDLYDKTETLLSEIERHKFSVFTNILYTKGNPFPKEIKKLLKKIEQYMSRDGNEAEDPVENKKVP